jgi:thioredoxin-related protein
MAGQEPLIIMKILLFVSSHCPHCPKAEKVAMKIAPEYQNYGVTLSKIRTKIPEGKELSLKYDVMATPSILMLDDDGNEIKRIVGVPSEDKFREEIEKLLGLRRSFFSRIWGA